MSRHFSSQSPTFLLSDNLDMQRLHEAQQCLRCREHREIPSSAETEAWEWFHPTYHPFLRHWALGCHINRNDVNDCLQEIWIEVMNKLPAFDSDGTQGGLCSWLHAIVHAKAVDLLRYQSRHPWQDGWLPPQLHGRPRAVSRVNHGCPLPAATGPQV
jgi:DNA-directed RNA polymerase specialized sigma24 family protein